MKPLYPRKTRFVFAFILILLSAFGLTAQKAQPFMRHDAFAAATFRVNNGMVPDYQGEPVKFFSNRDHINAYFTKKGVICELDDVRPSKDNAKDDDAGTTIKRSQLYLTWVGANADAEISGGEKSEGYFTYLKGEGKDMETVKTIGYKDIVYKNLYPGIDVHYSFPEKGGLKYNLVVHPGADLSLVKLDYTGDIVSFVKNDAGELQIETQSGKMLEHAPVSYTESGQAVASQYELHQENTGEFTVQFSTPDGYDNTQSLTVDPWMVATTFTGANVGMNVDYDSIGNTYAYGAGPTTTLGTSTYFQIAKYDVTGTLLWTFNGNITSIGWNSFSVSNGNTNYPGNLYVDKSSQKIYVSKGHDGTATSVVRLNSSGAYDNFITATNTNFQEAWGLKYNCTDSTLFALGGGPSSNINMAIINTTTGAIDTANFTHQTGGHQDIVCGTFDNFGNLYVVMNGTGSNLPYTNTMYRVDNTNRNYTWSVNSTYTSMVEETNDPYWSSVASGNWNNCLAANSSYLYYWDGLYLAAYNLLTGAKLGSTTVLGFILLLKEQGGIVADNCNNVYAGGDDGVLKCWSFNGSTFTSLADIDLPAAYNQDNPQDLKYNSNNNLLYITGGGQDGGSFVGTMVASYSTGCSLISTTHTCDSAAVHVSTTAGTIFTYTWTDTAGAVVGQTIGSTDSINSISGLAGGKYYISVQGQTNCNGSSLIDSVILTGGTATISTLDTLCSIIATATVTGTGPFTYAWSTGPTTQSIDITTSGTYTVTVTAGGCTGTASSIINAPVQITAATTTNSAGCSGNGSASVNITRGTGPFTYVWSNSDTSQTISVGAGTYTVTVYGSGGCTATASATVGTGGTSLGLSTSTTSAGCINNGTATATVVAGAGPYTYSWNNSSSFQTDSNLAAGTYTVTVTGAGGCSATASVTVTQSGSNLSLSDSSAVASCGNSNGIAGVIINSGTPPYTYLWSNGGIHDTIAGVLPGSYTVTVTGAGSCTATASVSVSASTPITASTSTTQASCNTSNGSATVTVSTGSGPFSYAWSNNGSGATISNITAGSYTVTITGAYGCTATATALVTSSNGVTIVLNAANTTCGNTNGSVIAVLSTGTPPYTYSWNNTATSDTISNLPAGTYVVTVTDAHNCSGTASAIVGASLPVSDSITTNKTIMCSGDSATICALTPYPTYFWSTGDTTQCITTSYAGNYYVSVTDAFHCTAVSNTVNLSIYNPTPVTISVSGDTLTSYTAVSYQWYLNGQPIPGDTTNMIIATASGTYTVVVQDVHGCFYTSSPTIVSGINNVYLQDMLSVYPNPLQLGTWHIDINETLIGSLCEMYDAEGRIVYKGELKSTQNEISLNVASGVYLLRVIYANNVACLKLIKM